MLVNNFSCLPKEILESIFKMLSPKELSICASICKAWQSIADQEKLWKEFITEKENLLGLKSKQIFINNNKSKFFSVFSDDLILALGGDEKVRELPYISFNEPRAFKNGIIQLSELNTPLTVGRISIKSLDSSVVIRYAFLAIRFINREFDEKCTEKDINIWITEGKSWRFMSGNIGGWPTLFLKSDRRSNDFQKTIDYIGRLVRGEPCGVRNLGSLIEHSKLTPMGTSTVSLA